MKPFPGIPGKSLVRMLRVKPMQENGPSHDHKVVLPQGWGSIPGAGLLALYSLLYINPKHTQPKGRPFGDQGEVTALAQEQATGLEERNASPQGLKVARIRLEISHKHITMPYQAGEEVLGSQMRGQLTLCQPHAL